MSVTSIQRRHIQILRGVAIIAVVFIHNTPSGLPQVFLRPFFNVGVGLFLFLSGLLSKRDSWNPQKRLIKVLVPYTIWTFVYVCVNNINDLFTIPFEYIKALLFGDSAAIMYYIFVYCQFTLLIPLIDKLANSRYKYLGLIITPIEIIFMRTIPILFGYSFNSYINLILRLSCLGWFTFFYLGYLIGNNKIFIKCNNTFLLVSFMLSIFTQIAEGYLLFLQGYANCGTQFKLSSILTGVIFAIIGYRFINSSIPVKCEVLNKLGGCSFGIYFSHMLIMYGLREIPFYKEYVIYPFNALIVVLVSYMVCYLGQKILKKYSWIFAL